LLSFYLPKWSVPFGRPIVHALCDPPLRSAMGFRRPPGWMERLVPIVLNRTLKKSALKNAVPVVMV